MCNQTFFTSLLVISALSLTQCSLIEDSSDEEEGINLADGFLSDFQLVDANYTAIEIIDPEVIDGVEVKHGEVKLTLPYVTSYITSENEVSLQELRFRLESAYFDQADFTIYPNIGALAYFSFVSPTTYEIKHRWDTTQMIHYDVYIEQETEVPSDLTEVALTGFNFEPSWNDGIDTDELGAKFMIEDSFAIALVPIGTDFTQLTPSLRYVGSKVGYSINGGETIDYPASGKAIDFKYPNEVDLVIMNEDESISKSYRLLVDVINPILLVDETIEIPDVNEGVRTLFETGGWIHQGNIPLNFIVQSTTSEDIMPEGDDLIPFGGTIHGGSFNGGFVDVYPGEIGTLSIHVDAEAIEGYYESLIHFIPDVYYSDGSPFLNEGSLHGETLYDETVIKVSVNIISE